MKTKKLTQLMFKNIKTLTQNKTDAIYYAKMIGTKEEKIFF